MGDASLGAAPRKRLGHPRKGTAAVSKAKALATQAVPCKRFHVPGAMPRRRRQLRALVGTHPEAEAVLISGAQQPEGAGGARGGGVS